MDKSKRGLIFLLVPLFVSLGIYIFKQPSAVIEEYTLGKNLTVVPISYDQNRLDKSFAMAVDSQRLSSVRGVIAPHHLVASDMIAEVLAVVQFEKIKRVIIIGPNHFERGDYTALSAGVDWEVGGETVKNDQQLFSNLQTGGYIQRDDETVIAEHAMTVLIPYIQHMAPDVEILPIVLSENQSIEQLVDLGRRLTPDDETLIIASIDFSHYLPLEEANKRDEITLSLIEARDYQAIYELNSDYLDSSSSLIAFLTAMDQEGQAEYHVLGHSNSAIIQGADHTLTTSYFTILFQ